MSRRPGAQISRFAVGLVAIAGPLCLSACAGAEQSGIAGTAGLHLGLRAGRGLSIGAIESDNAVIEKALATHRAAGVIRTACSLLASDATAGNSNLPSPDTQLTTVLENAYRREYRP